MGNLEKYETAIKQVSDLYESLPDDDLNKEEVGALLDKLSDLSDIQQQQEQSALNATELAKLLHALMCNQNHIDGCSWEYEKGHQNKWTRTAHRNYLEMAKSLQTKIQRLAGFVGDTEVIFILEMLVEIKKGK